MSAAPGKSCGTCTLCCKVMGVPDLPAGPKQPHTWCEHCLIGNGCGIYSSRPETCRQFECVWLQAPYNVLDDRYRPDRVKVVLQPTDNGQGLVAHCDPSTPLAWRHPRILDLLRQVSKAGEHASAGSGDRYWVVTYKTEWPVPKECLVFGPNGKVDVRIPSDMVDRLGVRGK